MSTEIAQGIDYRTYRFGQVLVDIFPELVTIAIPYDSDHEEFVDASVFIERYTHSTEALVFEDDDLRVELRVYPNIDNLIGEPPYLLPGPDPRLEEWTELRRRPVPVHEKRPPLLFRLAAAEQFVQEITVRASVGAAVALPQAVSVFV